MFAYIVRRVLATIPVMAIVALFVFSLLYIAPGDPAAVIAGDQATPADVERIRASLGLDRPFLVRFGEWVWRILQGDMGTSIFTNLPVTTMIAQRIEPTLSLMSITLILAVSLAVPMGVVAAWKAGEDTTRAAHWQLMAALSPFLGLAVVALASYFELGERPVQVAAALFLLLSCGTAAMAVRWADTPLARVLPIVSLAGYVLGVVVVLAPERLGLNPDDGTLHLLGPLLAVLAVLLVRAIWRAGSATDRALMLLSVLGFSIPVFVVGYLLAYVFALELDWFPVQGYTPFARGFGPWLQNLVLPAIALGSVYIALITRITRATMLEVLQQDYVRTARAKGVGQRGILFLHALKNAAVPIITVIGIGVALLIGGSVVTESVFAIPGLGRLTVDAILRRDYPVIQGVILLFSFVYVLVNLLIDLLYTLFDPRIRY